MRSDTYAFIVRLWREDKNGAGDPGDWRGSVDYVVSDQRLYFIDLKGLSDFIYRHSGIRLPHSAPWWHTLRNLFRNGTQ